MSREVMKAAIEVSANSVLPADPEELAREQFGSVPDGWHIDDVMVGDWNRADGLESGGKWWLATAFFTLLREDDK